MHTRKYLKHETFLGYKPYSEAFQFLLLKSNTLLPVTMMHGHHFVLKDQRVSIKFDVKVDLIFMPSNLGLSCKIIGNQIIKFKVIVCVTK